MISEKEKIKSITDIYDNRTGRMIFILLFVEIFALSAGIQVAQYAFMSDKITLEMFARPGLLDLLSAVAGCVFLFAILKVKRNRVVGGALILVCGFLRGLQVSAIYHTDIRLTLLAIPLLVASELILFTVITLTALLKDTPGTRRGYEKSLQVRRVCLLLWLSVIVIDGIAAPFLLHIAA